MDKRIEHLHDLGCNTSQAMERMMNDEEFYIECLQEALNNPGFAGLKNALADGDAVVGFNCAHALKGVLGNVGLTPMFEKIIDIVEPLRRGDCSNLDDKLKELLEMRDKYAEVVE